MAHAQKFEVRNIKDDTIYSGKFMGIREMMEKCFFNLIMVSTQFKIQLQCHIAGALCD